jgi:uracil-DNA glycosylase family 4
MSVPNYIPSWTGTGRVALISDAASADDEKNMQPLSGRDGRFMAALLGRAGIVRENCFLGCVAPYKPVSGKAEEFSWSGDEIQEGLYQLGVDLAAFKPNVVVLFGDVSLRAAKDPLATKPAKYYSCAKWRGSLFYGAEGGPFAGLKCLVAYHPTYCLRDYEAVPLLQFDLRKAAREAASPLLNLPTRVIDTTLSEDAIIARLAAIRRDRIPVAIDIEGGIDTMSCISFAESPTSAFIVPIYTKAGHVVITPAIWRALALTLEDPYVPKILQNSLYDRFVLHYSYGIRVRNVAHDTMLKHWELYSELEKNLGVQCSIYTDQPYYKGDRKSDDDRTFYEYCCLDSCVTLEISNKLEQLITGCSRQQYDLNMALLNPFLYMELRGMRYDVRGAAERRSNLRDQLHIAQARLNAACGFGFPCTSLAAIKQRAHDVFYTKDGSRPRKEYIPAVARYHELMKEPRPTLATLGELEDLCEVSLNVGSQKQFMAYLYDTIKLPVQMSNIRGKVPHPTADYEALLKLSKWCIQNQHSHGFLVCQAALELRALQTRQQMLAISADRDGRIRCGYNLVGANTGRITCYESPTGSGYNLQTIPNYTVEKEAPGGLLGDRDLFLADDDHYIFQCDLAGADGWTVAAYCAMLGDNTMMEHYLFGIKPYAAIALKLAGRDVDFKDKVAIKEAVKKYKMTDIEKLVAKRTQHGGAYLEGGLTISRNVLKDSEGKTYISPAECDKLKNWYLREMYWGIPKWHDWIARRMKEKPVLTAASGQVRQFFGRPDDVLTKAVAFEPQANTTYATNLAAHKLWCDPDNRKPNGGFHIEPLHQVHDALLGQFRRERSEWAARKIQSYFNNTLVIAGQNITIPFEGAYGISWGNTKAGTI